MAELTGVKPWVMMLANGDMRVSHVSTHGALQDVSKWLPPESLRDVITLRIAERCQCSISLRLWAKRGPVTSP